MQLIVDPGNITTGSALIELLHEMGRNACTISSFSHRFCNRSIFTGIVLVRETASVSCRCTTLHDDSDSVSHAQFFVSCYNEVTFTINFFRQSYGIRFKGI